MQILPHIYTLSLPNSTIDHDMLLQKNTALSLKVTITPGMTFTTPQTVYPKTNSLEYVTGRLTHRPLNTTSLQTR